MDRREVKALFFSEVKKLEGTILEVGFGKQTFSKKYSEKATIYGVEFSNKIVIETEKYLREQNIAQRIQVLASSAEELPFSDNTFDFVVLSFCFCCFKSPKKILSEINRVLKDGGKIISFDHVRSKGIIGLFLDLSTPIYAFIHKNCHLNRDPLRLYKEENISVACKMLSNETFIPWLFTKCEIRK